MTEYWEGSLNPKASFMPKRVTCANAFQKMFLYCFLQILNVCPSCFELPPVYVCICMSMYVVYAR